jgi:hypothetical protein
VTLVHAMKRARELVASGWSEPFSAETSGAWCTRSAEGIARYCVVDALITTGAYPDGWELLEAVVAPSHAELEHLVATVSAENATPEVLRRFVQLCRAAALELDLQRWLELPNRRPAEVLRVFDVAILKFTSKEAA